MFVIPFEGFSKSALLCVYSPCSSTLVPLSSGIILFYDVCFPGSKDYQLVTWSRDQTLRIWRVDPQLQRVSVDRASQNVPVCSSHFLMLWWSYSCASAMVWRTWWSPWQWSRRRVWPLRSRTVITGLVPQRSTCRVSWPLTSVSGLVLEVIRCLQQHLVYCLPSDPDSGARQDSTAVPQTLQQEFSLVNLQIRNVNVEVRCLCGGSSHKNMNVNSILPIGSRKGIIKIIIIINIL